MSLSPFPRGSSQGLSNLRFRDSSSEPESQPCTPSTSQTWAATPTFAPAPALAPAPAPAPDHDLQSGDVDMIGRIIIVSEGAGKLKLKASRPSLHLNWRLKYGVESLGHKSRTYGLGPRNNPQRIQSGLRGEGTSQPGEGVDGVQVPPMAQQIAQLNQQLAATEARRLEGERAMQESMKSLQPQVLSHIACGRFGVPRSPAPHPDDDDDDIEPEDDSEYVDRTPDHEMP
ncbi:hypothetical protein K7X08_005189 [Anisodus acutangulus]|uniref:Uncharacterized protein n=1 Tax=Anisodus acutangulus TaxID=402998 RepID=A0A9Q1MIA3_9SOLA|nr:hypothetical protein K7X08_005189 [Anisodus acutangulus]